LGIENWSDPILNSHQTSSFSLSTRKYPIHQKLEQFSRRLEPCLCRSETRLWADQDSQTSAVQSAERVFICDVIAQIRDWDVGIEPREKTTNRIALIRRRQANLQSLVEFSQHKFRLKGERLQDPVRFGFDVQGV
jgi:hypothetical protein